jgi:hypothetical protein
MELLEIGLSEKWNPSFSEILRMFDDLVGYEGIKRTFLRSWALNYCSVIHPKLLFKAVGLEGE